MTPSLHSGQAAAPPRPYGGRGAASQLTQFIRFCEGHTGRRYSDHAAFHEFSVADYPRFWSLFLEWSRLAWEGPTEPACTDVRPEFAQFFPLVRLSYAENLLEPMAGASDDATAVISHHAYGPRESLTRGELRARARCLAAHLRRMGIGPGDSVIAVAGNNIELLVCALASATIGAAFSSAATDMAAPSLLSRFRQLSPKLLFANLVDGGEAASTQLSSRIGELIRGLPSLTGAVALDDGPEPPHAPLPIHRIADLATPSGHAFGAQEWLRFPFNQPLFTLFSSGTTGSAQGHRARCRGNAARAPQGAPSARGSPTGRQAPLSHLCRMDDVELAALGARLRVCTRALRRPAERTGDPLAGRLDGGRHRIRNEPHLSPALPGQRSRPGQRAAARQAAGCALHRVDPPRLAVRLGPREVGAMPLQSISGGTDIIGCFVLGNPEPAGRARLEPVPQPRP